MSKVIISANPMIVKSDLTDTDHNYETFGKVLFENEDARRGFWDFLDKPLISINLAV